MDSQPLIRSKAWLVPVRLMLGIAFLAFIEEVVYVKLIVKVAFNALLPFLPVLLLWSILSLIDAGIYYKIRYKIKDRKWVWAHICLTFFAIVLVKVLGFIAFATFSDFISPFIIRTLQFYCFWSSLILGHIFFIIALVQSFSIQEPEQPDDGNDLLSEIAV